MASEVPQETRRALRMNRWTLEPLLLGLAWISAFASALLAIAFVAAGLDAAVAVVVVISLWAAVAVVWSRVRSPRNLR